MQACGANYWLFVRIDLPSFIEEKTSGSRSLVFNSCHHLCFVLNELVVENSLPLLFSVELIFFLCRREKLWNFYASVCFYGVTLYYIFYFYDYYSELSLFASREGEKEAKVLSPRISEVIKIGNVLFLSSRERERIELSVVVRICLPDNIKNIHSSVVLPHSSSFFSVLSFISGFCGCFSFLYMAA